MSRTQRVVLLGLAAVVLVVGLVVVAGKGGSDGTAGTPQTVVVKNAKPVGGVRKLTWKKGQTIDLTIKSDTADEIHFHGYDVHKEVTKGASAHFQLEATIEGLFIVELENHKQTLADVKVEP